MANKKTVVQMYEEILAIPALTDEQKAFIEKRIEITQKKNAKREGAEPTPKQKEKMEETERLKNVVLGVMVADTTYTPTDLLKLVNTPDIASTQKLTPILSALADDGKVVREMVKGRNLYSLPKAEAEAEADE